MRDDFDIDDVNAIKVALTIDQVNEHDLPVSMEAKSGSANYDRFVDQYGTDAHELESMPPELLQQILRDTIDSVIDDNWKRSAIVTFSRPTVMGGAA